jgi:hypothetical protein
MGKIWRITFASDHTVTLSLPQDDAVDANLCDTKFERLFSGTWRLDGNEVTYTVEDKKLHIPKTTMKMRLSDFERAKPFGTDPDAYLERLR